MTVYGMRILNAVVLLPLICALMPAPRLASAQATSSLKVSGPVVIAPGATKDEHCFLGEVVGSTNAAITVRDIHDERRIRTFTYSPNLAAKMRSIVAQGNFQPGDKGETSCRAARNEAYAIKGSPSVPR